ncbi:glutaredoxin domain-containing protein [Micromonospora echinofusca]|uniref:Glutaredoxin domain-containing protein n=1 Tax=Micromonospora echinofusca TaxID=47858 RepID=A0ABS3VSN5_MICEH|nr:glutaredoxin domain-containing protein [Micromonospora echinofusca]MBO4207491.1 hypothetical protein [Micromonospora echinofusca]
MLRRWGLTGIVVVCGLLLAREFYVDTSPVAGIVALVAALGLAALLSPAAFPRHVSAADAAQRSARDGRAVVYWRPGCRYCLELRIRLGRDARRLHWVDIWRDPAGAAAVRAITGGNETVPTVVLAGQSYVNPEPERLRTLLHQG